ncbi:MAG: CDP-diacylglycerol--serine O-phosphatidyltransferase [Opitutaceae bacterium]|jgi:CDP-diacylglycerol--serine O-phosphatidyltransferase|nr:CDP-diacylglycerol--serine O-phosphatidyltransferase [Opitutaceae bacterium]
MEPSREPSSDAPAADHTPDVRQASRIYFLPNLMTAGNLFCGFLAVIWCIRANYATKLKLLGADTLDDPNTLFRHAVWFIFIAMLFDTLDGRLARMGGRESFFGAEFDSLADVVSFGMAPALMVFFLILSPTQTPNLFIFRQLGWLLGFVYLLCAAIRLARFNVITHPLLRRPRPADDACKDFLGLPVPAAAGTIASIVLVFLRYAENDKTLQQWLFIPLPLLLLVIAILMVSNVRYPSGKKVDLRTKTRLTTFITTGVVIATLAVFWEQGVPEYGILTVCLGYIFFGIIRHFRRLWKSRQNAAPNL